MAHILKLSNNEPVIHLKAYSGVQVTGVDETEVQCVIDAPQLATLVEEDGHVYVTVNASCKITVPVMSSIEIERGMGSVKIANIKNKINIEKVLGNLVLSEIDGAVIGKVGGNFSVKNAANLVQIEKVAGSLTVENVAAFSCEKVGGNCTVKDVAGDFRLEKAGGNFKGQSIHGETLVSKVGGSFVASDIVFKEDLKAGGKVKLFNCDCGNDLDIKAGGDINLGISESLNDVLFSIRSGGQRITIKTGLDDIEVKDYSYDYQLGENKRSVNLAAGGSVRLHDDAQSSEDIVGDLLDRFNFEESAFSELIQERVESATRKAEAKMKTAEIRLDQIRERVEQHRGFNVDFGFNKAAGHGDMRQPDQPVPPVTRPAGKKGATDEERLMILQMLQEKKITVDEAETLFKAMDS